MRPALAFPNQTRLTTSLVFGAGVVFAALIVGVAASIGPTYGIAAFAAVVAVPAVVVRPQLVAHILIVTIFANAVTVGGVTVERLAAPLAFIATASAFLTGRARLRVDRWIAVSIVAYTLIAIASLAWSVSESFTLYTLASLGISIVYMIALATLVQTREQIRAVLVTFTACSVVLALLWITRYASGVDRRFNTAGDPGFFAALQVVALPLVLVLSTSVRSALQRALLFIALGIIAGSVISTLSRGGLLSLGIVALMMTVIPARSLFRSKAQKGAVFVTVALGLTVLLAIAWPDLSRRFEVGFNQANVAGDRGDLWLAAMNGYSQHPVTGLGYGAFRGVSFQLLRVTPGVNLLNHLRFLDTGEYVHNAYLGSLAELGPAGLAAFLGILISVALALRRSAKAAARRHDEFLHSVCVAVGVALASMAVTSILLSTETSRSLWFLFGLVIALDTMVYRRQNPWSSGRSSPMLES